jgi:hypothetical protein
MKDGLLDFAAINQAALAAFPAVLNKLLPRGKAVGREIVALNLPALHGELDEAAP